LLRRKGYLHYSIATTNLISRQ